MTNFNKILPAHVAQAMAAATPFEAVELLAKEAGHEREYNLDCDEPTWSATSLAVRHGLLMEWLAAEVRDAT